MPVRNCISARGETLHSWCDGPDISSALVDTGADHTVLPLSIAENVGAELFYDERDAAKGISGHEIAIISGRVHLELLSDDETCAWTAVVGFADFATPEDECGVLGHAGCLEFFSATFDGVGQVVELIQRGSLPSTHEPSES